MDEPEIERLWSGQTVVIDRGAIEGLRARVERLRRVARAYAAWRESGRRRGEGGRVVAHPIPSEGPERAMDAAFDALLPGDLGTGSS